MTYSRLELKKDNCKWLYYPNCKLKSLLMSKKHQFKIIENMDKQVQMS